MAGPRGPDVDSVDVSGTGVAGSTTTGGAAASVDTITPEATATPESTAQSSWTVWQLDASVTVTDPGKLAAAEAIVRGVVAAVDLACSRFRGDSELVRLHAVAEPVDGLEAAQPDPVAQQPRHHHSQDKVQGHRPQPLPERLERTKERHHDVHRVQFCVGVKKQGAHVQPQEDRGEQGDVPVQEADGKPGQHHEGPAGPVQDPQQYGSGEQGKGHKPTDAAKGPHRFIHGGHPHRP